MNAAAAVLPFVLALAPADDGVDAQLEVVTKGPIAVGDRVVVHASIASRVGEEMRLAEALPIHASLVPITTELRRASDDQDDAEVTATFVACLPGAIEIGPFALTLTDGVDGERRVETGRARIDVYAPWGSGAVPPFGEWREPPADEPSPLRRILLVVAPLLALAAGAFLLRHGRATPARLDKIPRPNRTADLFVRWASLLADVPEEAIARRRWCTELHALLRVALSARSAAAAFAWSREELTAAHGFGAWDAADESAWRELLLLLEHGMFARDGITQANGSLAASAARRLSSWSAP